MTGYVVGYILLSTIKTLTSYHDFAKAYSSRIGYPMAATD